MAAGIEDRDTMVSTGKTPWHNLGARRDTLMTPAEALHEGGLDWDVIKEPLLVQHADGTFDQLRDWVATVRSSDGLPLGAVKPSYPVINNAELLDFLMAVTRVAAGNTKARIVEAAGSLYNAKIVWFLLRLPDLIDLGLGGTIEPYVVIASSHNATLKPTLKNTPTRVECANTLDMAIAGHGNTFAFKHTRGWRDNLPQAEEALGLSDAYLKAFERQARALIKARMTRHELDAYVQALFPARVEDEVPRRTQNRRDGVIALLAADNLANVRLTKWAAYNATADWIDHAGTFRETDTGSRDDNRAYSILTGQASSLKARALAILKEM